jgi:hypothetical protein
MYSFMLSFFIVESTNVNNILHSDNKDLLLYIKSYNKTVPFATSLVKVGHESSHGRRYFSQHSPQSMDDVLC